MSYVYGIVWYMLLRAAQVATAMRVTQREGFGTYCYMLLQWTTAAQVTTVTRVLQLGSPPLPACRAHTVNFRPRTATWTDLATADGLTPERTRKLTADRERRRLFGGRRQGLAASY